MKEWTDEQLEWGVLFLAAVRDILSTLINIVREFGAPLLRVVWKATVHPDNDREWRAVWIWVWVSIIYGLLVSFITGLLMGALPTPLNVIASLVWLVYTLICEPIAYFVYGHGFEARWHYVETGEYEYPEVDDDL